MHFTSHTTFDDGVIERRFRVEGANGVEGFDGILWQPASVSASTPVPLILMGHPGDLTAMYARLAARAKHAAASGFASATIELPGAGGRVPLADVDAARADLRRSLAAGERVPGEVVDRLILPLVERSVPEWQTTLDALLAMPEHADRVGYSGGVIAIGVRLAMVEPRIRAAGLFAGSYVPGATFVEARRVTIPVHVLLQWDDRGNDRQMALDLFDALASREKTLEANMGGHTGIPPYAGEAAGRFFERHLR
jgi:hypothetical protein